MNIAFADFSTKAVLIGSGYMHRVFRQGDYVYKCVRPEFADRNNASHFATECRSMDLLRKAGFPVPVVCDVLPPGAFFKDLWALRESYIDGVQYRDGEMPQALEAMVCDSLLQMADRIPGTPNVYGRIASDGQTPFHDWREYLYDIVDSNPYARKRCPFLSITNDQIKKLIACLVPSNPKPCFVAMDTNLMNYFFNRENQIVGITDIDRPIWGDSTYLCATIRWRRDHWFHRSDWYHDYIEYKIKPNSSLVDLYEFLIAYEEIDERCRTGKSHPSIDAEFNALGDKLMKML